MKNYTLVSALKHGLLAENNSNVVKLEFPDFHLYRIYVPIAITMIITRIGTTTAAAMLPGFSSLECGAVYNKFNLCLVHAPSGFRAEI